MFYPPEGLCRAEPEDGPIVFTLDFIRVDYHAGIFKSPLSGGLFEILKMFYLMGRDGLDGLDGLDGKQKCPLIFFILRYIKHYTHIYIYLYI